jgi:mannose-6-phosphate isomerase-like protein (cupin superfamily)
MRELSISLTVFAVSLFAADRSVDPTFLFRQLSKVAPKAADVSNQKCEYKPLFAEGDSEARIARGVARYGEITVRAGGASTPVSYPREEQIYYIVSGSGKVIYGDETQPVRPGDFMYLAPAVKHGLSTDGPAPLKAIVMGFKIPQNKEIPAPGKLQKANADEVKKQVVGNHPPSTLFQLMIGDVKSTRDRIAAGLTVTSLFIMEFAEGGTNFPHHHDREEEIYLLLDGTGDMVAGPGMDGVEGKFPAKPGDAYFYRLNTTVGFYNKKGGDGKIARILAVRSLYPFGGRP